MKTIISTIIFFMFSLFYTGNTIETCYCTSESSSWTAYCGSNIDCKKCCEITKPKPKNKDE